MSLVRKYQIKKKKAKGSELLGPAIEEAESQN